MSDPKTTWWIWRQVQTRLTKWALALLQGRRYHIQLTPVGTGFHAPVEKIIQANPQMFDKQPVEVQFRVTQGILAHEVGHAWFTGNWPDQEQGALQEIVNVLEDERIERSICRLYPGVSAAIRLLGDLVYAELEARHARPPEQALDCCLAWRWAATRTSENEMFTHLGTDAAGQELWAKVRPLVEAAWTAIDTTRVIELGSEILAILGISTRASRRKLCPITAGSASHIPTEGAVPLPLPTGPADGCPGLGTDLESADLPKPAGGHMLDTAAYVDLEEKVQGRASRLAEALQEPRPEVRLTPHEYQGRYTFRQEIRTPQTPNLARMDQGTAPRSLALYVLVDRSGSMSYYEEAVKEALMTVYLAASRLNIPFGAACFGDDTDYSLSGVDSDVVVAEMVPISAKEDEAVKALIAGYKGWSSNEYLDWGLRKAESELQPRPERLRVVLVIHDGAPVVQWKEATDWSLSQAHIQALERKGMIPIGVFLGTEERDLAKMGKLFTRLVACKGDQLPEKLGDLLRSLA